MNEYDTENLGKILRGHGDWFNAQLLRLICKADDGNFRKLNAQFPAQCKAVAEYRGWPKL